MEQGAVEYQHLVMRKIVAGTFLPALFVAATARLHAQAPVNPHAEEQAYKATMVFEVASVRRSAEAQSYVVSGGFSARSTHLQVTNFSLYNLLRAAYGYDFYRIEGIPDSFGPAMFNVEAHGDSDADAQMAKLTPAQETAERQHMMQALLAERFALHAHWETREGQVLRLVAPHGDEKLHRATPSRSEEPAMPLIQRNDPAGGYDFIGHGCSMAILTGMLELQFGRPVVNATGLSGAYNFFLPYDHVWRQDRQDDDPKRPPPLEESLLESLGLKVEPGKGNVHVLVIDHVEMPSPN